MQLYIGGPVQRTVVSVAVAGRACRGVQLGEGGFQAEADVTQTRMAEDRDGWAGPARMTKASAELAQIGGKASLQNEWSAKTPPFLQPRPAPFKRRIFLGPSCTSYECPF